MQGRASLATRVTKELELGGGRSDPTLSLAVTVENRTTERLGAALGIEWDLTMLGGGGNPAAYHEVAGSRSAHDGTGAAHGVDRVAAGNTYVGLRVETALEPPADAWWSPIETISNSESGFERIYQGASTVFVWPLALGPGERQTVRMAASVSTTRDHAADEERT